jgi:hypothetical protein
VRRSLGLVGALLALGGAEAAAQTRVSVAMPYTCLLERGRLVVAPSVEQSYQILGRREEQPYTACFGGEGSQCRTIMLHRFTIDCSGARVPWIEVVAAATAGREGPLHVALENGQMMLGRRPHGGRPGLRDSRRLGGPEAAVALPPGLAPMGMIGARLVLPVEATPAEPAPSLAVSAARAAVASPIAAVPPAARMPAPEPGAQAGRSAVQSAGWVTEVIDAVEVISHAQGADAGQSAADQYWLGIAGLSGLGTVAFLAWLIHAMRAEGRSRGRAYVAPAGALGSDAQMAEALRLTAAGLVPEIRASLDQIGAGVPLRQVLLRETHSAEQRLQALSRQAPADSDAWRRARVRMQGIVRELERLREIAEGANSSLAGRAEISEPRDRSEAFAVLGANPEVEEKILKRLVDVLRQSWHPDLAKDEADRQRREHRIKQINSAWDLIQGKRLEA